MTILLVILFGLASSLQASPPGKQPQRIASGTVGTDEILWELLKEERQRIIAVSVFSEDSRYSLLGPIPSWLKGRVGNSVESLLTLRPDLAILASYNRRELAPQLEAAGIRVLLQDNFRNLDAIYANILGIGEAVGSQQRAHELVTSMKQKISQWTHQRPACSKPSAIMYSSQGSLPGKDTTFTSALEAAGFRNLVAEKGLKSWAPLNNEVLLGLQPDFVVLASSAETQGALSRQIRKDPIWGRMNAVKAGRLIFVPEALLSTVSHHVIDLVERFHLAFKCPQ